MDKNLPKLPIQGSISINIQYQLISIPQIQDKFLPSGIQKKLPKL
jgi:hypothetical protein